MSAITIIGVGINGRRDLTLEGVRSLREADVVYHLITGHDAVALLHELNPTVFDLSVFYRDGLLDLDVYGQIASFVLARALSGQRVVFAVMGHPSIYVAPTHLIALHGPRYRVDVRVVPGVSTIDAILALLPWDIGNTGLQILDANRLVSYGLEPQANIPLLLLQAGCFGSGVITRQRTNRPDRLQKLACYLMNFYSRGHPATLLECDMGYPHAAKAYDLTIEDLARAGHLVTYNTTLLVPPAVGLRYTDQAFVATLIDPQVAETLVVGR